MNLRAHWHSQSAPLIHRQPFDPQRWLLHGDTNHNRDVDTKPSGRKRTFKLSNSSHLQTAVSFLLSVPPFISWTNPSRTKTPQYQILWGVCIMCRSLSTRPLLSSWTASTMFALIVSPSASIPWLIYISSLRQRRNWVTAQIKFPHFPWLFVDTQASTRFGFCSHKEREC